MKRMVSAKKHGVFFQTLALFCLISSFGNSRALAEAVGVVFLTHKGSRTLKTWNESSLSTLMGKKGSAVTSQSFLFDEANNPLELNDLASIDLVTVIAEKKTIRVPRFLIWRGFFQFRWNSASKKLSSFLKNNQQLEEGRILLPSWYFDVEGIRRIELSDHQVSYPSTKLSIRTNPAASRGEKVFTQNCLACHSVTTYGAPALSPIGLTKDQLGAFTKIHHKWPELKLDPRLERGLIEYSEALAFEKNEVKLKK